jgi:hypothetical protein
MALRTWMLRSASFRPRAIVVVSTAAATNTEVARICQCRVVTRASPLLDFPVCRVLHRGSGVSFSPEAMGGTTPGLASTSRP